MFQPITRELDELCPLTNAQWDFRATTSAVLSTTSHWLELLEAGKDIYAVFFDRCQAFDTVPHRPLQKPISLNLNGFLIQ